MGLRNAIQGAWHRIRGMELQKSHTAITLHWTAACGGQQAPPHDRVFMIRGILQGTALEVRIKALVAEHAIERYGVTEVGVFWHLPSGRWELREALASSSHGLKWLAPAPAALLGSNAM